MKKGHIDVISLGCSKNLVDSERLLKRLSAKGYTVSHDPEEVCGEYAVVNTCGFIADAKEESIDMLLRLGQLKQDGAIGRIVVMGCLSERYKEELQAEMPEIDIWYGKFDWADFINKLPSLTHPDSKIKTPEVWERKLTTPAHSAYLKISEGCNRFCAFCAIPLITGRHVSRSIEEIEEEVKCLVSEGVSEFNVIAQDLSSYGTDLYGRHALADLIERLAKIDGVHWLRLHYAYPSDFPEDILRVMRENKNVCSYLDIALQHINDGVLSNMQRHITREQTDALLAKMRCEVPDIKIRTTLMVGFPGETEDAFEELVEWVKEVRFDRMGAFAYCEEDDTNAAKLFEDSIPEEVKQNRLDRLMSVQKDISFEVNQEMIGKRVEVLIDKIEGDYAVGRTQWDSPEVDPEVYVENTGDIDVGDYIEVCISDASEFELYARKVNK